jgi:predicted kinase
MRRLPEKRMMNRLLEQGAVDSSMIRSVAARLSVFHANAKTSKLSAHTGDRAIRYAWRENFVQWAPSVGEMLTAAQDQILHCFGEAFFARRSAVLERRVAQLRIRECHSDLRSDAVCFTDGICIFDCVEFSRRIRLVDVARDVGFLAMDLEYRSHPELADAFVNEYVRLSGDKDLPKVIGFYKCYNACVRAKVEGLLVGESEVPTSKRRAARKAARRYFDLACRYASEVPPAMLIITCGLPGTGKSTLARSVAERTGFTVLSSDIVRKEIAGLAAKEHRYEAFAKGIYAPDFTERTYVQLLKRARTLLLAGRSVILDASFIRRSHRKAALRLAKETGAQFACLVLEVPPESVHRRLARRLARGAGPSDARWETYAAQKRRFQRPTEIATERLWTGNTTRPAAKTTQIVKWVEGISPLSLQERRPRRDRG